VDELNEQGIFRIVCVSHNGYEDDKYLASMTQGISLIVGGHPYSLLLKKEGDEVVGTYPSPVINSRAGTTYVVQGMNILS
jgi:2',3'-cyclic-nucleotide 2'-phosphodiesterase (5'-nucleotidase family)